MPRKAKPQAPGAGPEPEADPLSEPALGQPVDELPEDRLSLLARELDTLYLHLGLLAEQLFQEASIPPNESTLDFLDNLSKRAPLDEVRGYVLSARHDLHGALIALVRARGIGPGS